MAMSLLRRLNLLEKFLILGTIGLMMSALPTYLVVRDSLHAIDHARLEAQGVAPAQALTLLVQRMQVHQGLSVGMLGGASRWLRAALPHAMRSTPRWTT